jgi:hypothetical protein
MEIKYFFNGIYNIGMKYVDYVIWNLKKEVIYSIEK